jgi:hypothetical protein
MTSTIIRCTVIARAPQTTTTGMPIAYCPLLLHHIRPATRQREIDAGH